MNCILFSRLDPTTAISNRENALQIGPQHNLIQSITTEFSLDNLNCVKLTVEVGWEINIKKKFNIALKIDLLYKLDQ